jgi:sarcosine oxidase subunit gamma
MAERAGFKVTQIDGRSIIRLRVRLDIAHTAASAMQLPQRALQSSSGNPNAHWLGPDQWLLTSENTSVADILINIDEALSGQLYSATDLTCALNCLSLTGPTARTVLAMGCGIDMHPDSFPAGRCVRTRFAQVPVLIAARGDSHFDLYVDRSYAQYLFEWIESAGEDPMTCSRPDL